MQKSISYYGLAQSLGRMLAKTSDVRVVFAGAQAHTDSKLIVIPALPPGTMITPQQAKVFGGYIDHEASHVKRTDHALWRATIDAKPKNIKSLFHWLWNVIEDVWIENAAIDEYPGSRENLDACRRATCQASFDKWLADEAADHEHTYADRVIALIHHYVFATFRNCPEFSAYDPDTLLAHPELSALVTVLNDLPAVHSTKTAIALAERLLAVLPDVVRQEHMEDLHDEPENEPKSPAASAGDASNADTTDGDASEDSDSDDASGDGTPSEGGKPSDEPSEGNGDGPPLAADAADEKPSDQLPKGEVRVMRISVREVLKALQKAAESALDGQSYEQFMQKVCDNLIEANSQPAKRERETMAEGKWFPRAIILPEWVYPESDYVRYHAYRDAISAEVSAMKRRLHIQLRAMRAEDWTRGLEDGELDPDALYLVKTGNYRRLYRQPCNMDAVNTDIAIMADGSLSMHLPSLVHAFLALAEAIAGVENVKLHCGMFHGWGTIQLAPGIEALLQDNGKDAGKGLGLCSSVELVCLKDFNETWQRCAGRFGAIKTKGSTPMSAGYDASLELLAMRKTERRMLMLVTDGDTNGQGLDPEYNDCAAMAVSHQQAIKCGIETYGFELGSQAEGSLEGLVDRTFFLKEGAISLPAAVMKLFSTRITYKR